MKVREGAVSYRKMMEIRSRFNEADNLVFFMPSSTFPLRIKVCLVQLLG